jgi:hypothetical protein
MGEEDALTLLGKLLTYAWLRAPATGKKTC